MAQYLTILGGSAYSDFKRQGFAKQLGVAEIRARYVHYIALHDKLAENDRDALDNLLAYGDEYLDSSPFEGGATETYYVCSRTISPWSSKATNIAHICLGETVKRIERDVVINVVSEKGYDKELAAEPLHDRMTQTFSTEKPNLEDGVFVESKPTPAKIIDLYVEGTTPQQALRADNKEMGLALDESEIDYLVKAYSKGGPIARSPFDVELRMFAQVNSEHCVSLTYLWISPSHSFTTSFVIKLLGAFSQKPQKKICSNPFS